MSDYAPTGGLAIEMWLADGEHPTRDQDLQRRVWDEFRWEPLLDVSAVQVVVAEGAATLTGTVPAYAHKALALRAAARVAGLAHLCDALIVRPPVGEDRGDPELEEETACLLEWNAAVPRRGIRATVSGGWVRLEGEVALDVQRREAEAAIEHLVGIRGVTNLIHVRPAQRAAGVDERLHEALARAIGGDARHLRVRTEQGIVTLTGHLRSLAERASAEHAALGVPGVVDLRSEITIAV
jgi:osmotically-inducible protein OsmY